MTSGNRREFIRSALGGIAGAGLTLPLSIQKALAIPARSETGTIRDVRHVVILMKENRSFDHYFGTLRGVRGFRDPHPIPLPGGAPVWNQRCDEALPEAVRKQDGMSAFANMYTPISPFRLNTLTTSAQSVPDLPHGWLDTQGAMNHGRWDQWVPQKGLSFKPTSIIPRLGLTMGHYYREDIPFHFALADAFTVCDAYHCSFAGSTTPNRIFLWTGTNDPGAAGGGPVVDNSSSVLPPSPDNVVDVKLFDWFAKEYGRGIRYTFKTYPERLEAAGISWRMYGGETELKATLNPLVAFNSFAWAPEGSALRKKGMTPSSLEDFKQHVLAGTLPQVSWIVPEWSGCEHPAGSSPVQGAEFNQQVLDALTANPEVWSRTVLFIMFDENDGYFDHMPAPAAPSHNPDGTLAGGSTVETATEIHKSGRLYGLGPRVPMFIISPWTKGGWVNSEVFDHTSVIRFMEKCFGVMEPNISPWRRAVCGDLTSAFDFGHPDRAPAFGFPDVAGSKARVEAQSALPVPAPPVKPEPLFQEPGTRPSRALPYELHVDSSTDAGTDLTLNFSNTGRAGAVFQVYDMLHLDRIPRRYTVEAGKSLHDRWSLGADAGRYALRVYGPNGFFRELRGTATAPGSDLDVSLRYNPRGREIIVQARNAGTAPVTANMRLNNYGNAGPWPMPLKPGEKTQQRWSVEASGLWYDVIVEGPDGFHRRFAGRVETGRHTISDPAMGAPARQG